MTLQADDILDMAADRVRSVLVPKIVSEETLSMALAQIRPGLRRELENRVRRLPWGGLLERSERWRWLGATAVHPKLGPGVVEEIRGWGASVRLKVASGEHVVASEELQEVAVAPERQLLVSRLLEDAAYKNARENSDPQNARIEHDKAVGRVMVDLFTEDQAMHGELYRRYVDDEGFRRSLHDQLFAATFERGVSLLCERCGHVADQAERHNAIAAVECPAGTTEFRPATPAEVKKYGRRVPGPPRPGTWRFQQAQRQKKADERAARKLAEEEERQRRQAARQDRGRPKAALGARVPPGCPRCRLDKIRFTRDVQLPRFKMRAGEGWNLPQSRYQPDGSAALGGGFIPAGAFEIVTTDECRATGCTCGRISSGPPARGLAMRPVRHTRYIARVGMPATGGMVSGQGAQLTEIELAEGTRRGRAFVRESTLREAGGFYMTANQRWGEKTYSKPSEPQVLQLALDTGPWTFEEVAKLITTVDPKRRKVTQNRRFTAKWALNEFAVGPGATGLQQHTAEDLRRGVVLTPDAPWVTRQPSEPAAPGKASRRKPVRSPARKPAPAPAPAQPPAARTAKPRTVAVTIAPRRMIRGPRARVELVLAVMVGGLEHALYPAPGDPRPVAEELLNDPALAQHLFATSRREGRPFSSRPIVAAELPEVLATYPWLGDGQWGELVPSFDVPDFGGPRDWDMVWVGCGDLKQEREVPAIELYTGPCYRAHLSIARHARAAGPTHILSAEHKLLPPWMPTRPYKRTLDDPEYRRAWSEDIFGAAAKLSETTSDEVIIATFHRRPTTGLNQRRETAILVLAGKVYVDGWADRARALGVLVDEPLRGLEVGERRQFAARFLRETPPRSPLDPFDFSPRSQLLSFANKFRAQATSRQP